MSGETRPQRGAAREALMARICAALGRPHTIEPPDSPAVPDEIVRQVAPGEDLVRLFERHATELGLQVLHAAAAADAAGEAEAILSRHAAQRVVFSRNLPAEVQFLPELLASRGFASVPWDEASGILPLFDADAGVTEAAAGLADCGAIVCRSSPAHARGLSLAAPLHIAILPRSAILPDLVDFWRRAAAQGIAAQSSAVVMIAGPSKTADIEGVLVTGVHGPRDVYIVILDNV